MLPRANEKSWLDCYIFYTRIMCVVPKTIRSGITICILSWYSFRGLPVAGIHPFPIQQCNNNTYCSARQQQCSLSLLLLPLTHTHTAFLWGVCVCLCMRCPLQTSKIILLLSPRYCYIQQYHACCSFYPSRRYQTDGRVFFRNNMLQIFPHI